MLWFELLPGSPRTESSTCHVPTDSPYPFSVYLHEERGVGHESAGYSYNFLVNGEGTHHSLALGLRGGRIQSIEGVGIDRGQCSVYDSPYTEMGIPEADASMFALVPLPQDEKAELSGSTIRQTTKVSLSVYRDAVLFSFDRFAGARRVALAPGFDALVATTGLLAGFLFRGRVADELKALVLARLSNQREQDAPSLPKRSGRPVRAMLPAVIGAILAILAGLVIFLIRR